jgi:hypothetical protein
MIRIVVLLTLVAILASSCKSTKETKTDKTVAVALDNNVTPDDIVFTLKKGACFGSCPEYTLRIYNNLYTEFIGKNNTNKIGTYAKMIGQSEYDDLVKKFEKADFFSFDETYESNISDLPSSTISYKKEELKKSVTGKMERPEAVHKLQFALESIAESANGWQQLRNSITEDPEDPKFDRARIVVEIAKANELARWFTKMRKEYGVQILKSLSGNNDTWLISYDTKEYTPERIMQILESDPVVKSAKFEQIN